MAEQQPGQQPGQQQPHPPNNPPANPPAVEPVPPPQPIDPQEVALGRLLFVNAPQSPWAERFGNSGNEFFSIPYGHADRKTHSGLAPEFPRLPVPEYASSPFVKDGPPMAEPNLEETDRLLLGMQSQRNHLGIHSNYLGVLNDELHDGIPGGHNYDIMRMDRYKEWENFRALLVKVDESTWLSNFRKAKASAPPAPCPPPRRISMSLLCTIRIVGTNPIKKLRENEDIKTLGWSVDIDAIWEALSPIIELVNRIFLQLIKEKSRWLATVLFAESEAYLDTYPEAYVPGRHADDIRRIIFDDEAKANCDPETLRREIELRGKIVKFGIWDELVHPDPHSDYALTCKRNINPGNDPEEWEIWIHYGAAFLRPLLEENTTLAERCHIMFCCAINLVHEYAHALRQAPPSTGGGEPEPFIESEWIGEVGLSLEAHIFGGERPYLHPGQWLSRGQTRGICTNAEFRYCPEPSIGWAYSHSSEGRLLWANTNREKFWTETVAKYGSKAFHAPHLFQYYYVDTQHSRRMVTEVTLTPSFEDRTPPEFIETANRVRTKFAERDKEWLTYRPWSASMGPGWFDTPWGWGDRRGLIEKFRYYHRMRDLEESRKIALAAVRYEEQFHFGALHAVPAQTIFYLIATLMFASLPITTGEFQIESGQTIRPFSLAPIPIKPKDRASYRPNSSEEPGQDRRGRRFEFEDPRPRQNVSSSDFWWSQSEALEDFQTALVDLEWQYGAEREANPLATQWTAFPFSVPTYAQDWVRFDHPVEFSTNSQERYRECEVGNHRSLADAWVIYPDGMFGHDVYQISDLLQTNGANEADYRAIVKTGPFGPELVSNDARADYIRNTFKSSLNPMGKLIPKRRPEEVSDFDGSNGMPRWVTAGSFAFDLTHFPFSDQQEEQLLSKSAGGPIQIKLSPSNPAAKDLMNRLQPHFCAIVEADRPETHSNDQQFTPRTLRWRDNPDLGCYMAIGGAVYDLEGGDLIMRQYLGLDATEAFLKVHNLDILKDFENSRVGTIIPEVGMDQINRTHIVLNGFVYDISTSPTPNAGLYELMKNYGGTDASAELEERSAGFAAMNELIRRPDRIIAAISHKLPDIPAGEVSKHDNPHKPQGAWVTIGEYVYNVRDLMLFPAYYERHIPEIYAGAELDDPSLAKWLVEKYAARCIGRLKVGAGWAKPPVETIYLDNDNSLALSKRLFMMRLISENFGQVLYVVVKFALGRELVLYGSSSTSSFDRFSRSI
ncbi:hypothetical protein F4810DRAFT_716208 [Camillea tinctor]|nr:hypothetical protein F4810DRAFT_716208 [Camillea tinctor]